MFNLIIILNLVLILSKKCFEIWFIIIKFQRQKARNLQYLKNKNNDYENQQEKQNIKIEVLLNLAFDFENFVH